MENIPRNYTKLIIKYVRRSYFLIHFDSRYTIHKQRSSDCIYSLPLKTYSYIFIDRELKKDIVSFLSYFLLPAVGPPGCQPDDDADRAANIDCPARHILPRCSTHVGNRADNRRRHCGQGENAQRNEIFFSHLISSPFKLNAYSARMVAPLKGQPTNT